jgi:hypothetical protein
VAQTNGYNQYLIDTFWQRIAYKTKPQTGKQHVGYITHT